VIYHLTRISVWPAVKTAFTICGLIGLAFGTFYGLILAIVGSLINMVFGGAMFEHLNVLSGMAGMFVAVFLGMASGVAGALWAAVVVWLYNVLAHVTGGIELELEPQAPAPAEPSPEPPAPEPLVTQKLGEPDPSPPASNPYP
jgi:hypothetical protein